jgi:hypothetical protein
MKVLLLLFLFNLQQSYGMENCKNWIDDKKESILILCKLEKKKELDNVFTNKFINENIEKYFKLDNRDDLYLLTNHLVKTPLCNFLSNSLFKYSIETKSFLLLMNTDKINLELALRSPKNSILTLKNSESCQNLPNIQRVIAHTSDFLPNVQYAIALKNLSSILYLDSHFNLQDYNIAIDGNWLLDFKILNGHFYAISLIQNSNNSFSKCVIKLDEQTKSIIWRSCKGIDKSLLSTNQFLLTSDNLIFWVYLTNNKLIIDQITIR